MTYVNPTCSPSSQLDASYQDRTDQASQTLGIMLGGILAAEGGDAYRTAVTRAMITAEIAANQAAGILSKNENASSECLEPGGTASLWFPAPSAQSTDSLATTLGRCLGRVARDQGDDAYKQRLDDVIGLMEHHADLTASTEDRRR